MADQNQNLTVLIKKADGSFARVPLSDFQKSQNQKPEEKIAKSENKPSETPRKENVKPLTQADNLEKDKVNRPRPKPPVKQPAPTTVQTLKSQPAKSEPPKATKEDQKPLIQEQKSVAAGSSLTSSSREKQIDEVLSSISFKPPVGNSNRLRTIVQLFLKDIRNEEQTLEILERRELEGGVGLSKIQAEEVVSKAKAKNIPEKTISVQPLKTGLPINRIESDRLEKEIPMIREVAKFPATSTPNNSFRHGPKINNEKFSSKEILEKQTTLASLDSAPVFSRAEPVSEFKIKKNEVKPPMQDITTGHIEVGPVDEIKYINLVDFRRLSGTPEDAGKRLKQKFINLKDESIVLYFEALSAWHASPLYHDYIQAVSEALSRRVPLASVCQDKSKIQVPEINAVLRMEKEIM